MATPSFQTIRTKRPWYRNPVAILATALFVVLGAGVGFLLKGDEATLLGRVKSSDAVSPVCAYALGWRGIQKDATRDTFEQLLASGTTETKAPEEVRRACAWSLGRVKQRHSVLYLIDALEKDPSVPVRCAAARALGVSGEPEGCQPLMLAVNDGEGDVREAAADGCGRLGDKRAIDPLIDRLEDSLPAVRRACHEALVSLTGTSFDGTEEKLHWRRWREAGH
jgi:HEAT repeat protein